MKVNCKICNEGVDTSTSGWKDSANKCEYCNEYFCNSHIHWENHLCEKGIRQWSDEQLQDKIEKTEKGIQSIDRTLKDKTLWVLGGLGGGIGMALNEERKEGLKKKIEFYKKELKRRESK